MFAQVGGLANLLVQGIGQNFGVLFYLEDLCLSWDNTDSYQHNSITPIKAWVAVTPLFLKWVQHTLQQ